MMVYFILTPYFLSFLSVYSNSSPEINVDDTRHFIHAFKSCHLDYYFQPTVTYYSSQSFILNLIRSQIFWTQSQFVVSDDQSKYYTRQWTNITFVRLSQVVLKYSQCRISFLVPKLNNVKTREKVDYCTGLLAALSFTRNDPDWIFILSNQNDFVPFTVLFKKSLIPKLLSSRFLYLELVHPHFLYGLMVCIYCIDDPSPIILLNSFRYGSELSKEKSFQLLWTSLHSNVRQLSLSTNPFYTNVIRTSLHSRKMSPQNQDNLGMHLLLGLKEIDTFLIHLMWSFNFSLDFTPSPLYKTVGAFYSGMDATGTGVQQMLLSKSIIRYQMLHYANQFAHYEMVTFIKYKSYFSFLKLLQPFELPTWLAIIISSSLVTFILFCTLQKQKQNVFGFTSVALWIDSFSDNVPIF